VYLEIIDLDFKMNDLEKRVQKIVNEHISIVPYNDNWKILFNEEKKNLFEYLPSNLIKRIEHFGSTSIPNLSAKPIIDILVEVTSLEETKTKIVPLLEMKGYEYFWRPCFDEDKPPYYAWFIKRDSNGIRTHHIHMVEKNFDHWDRLLFRDYLIKFPIIAHEYEILKLKLSNDFPDDRIAYTKGKTEFIIKYTNIAKNYFK
jgi:GrpB-like predicted nucleotidyltransferase (UPF0157 family)